MTIKEAALDYLQRGMSIIPLNKDKKALISWKEYQERLPTKEEVLKWVASYPNMNIGIVTGKISNLTVIDCDSQAAIDHFSTLYKGVTPCVKTPKGMHYYFQYQEGVRNAARILPDTDIRSEGGYVVAPPSTNGNNNKYIFIKDFNIALDIINNISLDINNNIALNKDINNNIYNNIYNNYYIEDEDSAVHTSLKSVHKLQNSPQKSTMFEYGNRDESLFHTANCLAKGFMPDHEIVQVLLAIMNSWGENDPRWAEAKVKSVMSRITRRERNLAEDVLEYVLSTTGVFFSTDITKSLQLSTRQENKNLSIILRRLCEKGVIEKGGIKNGCWRKVDKDLEIIDWKNADDVEYPVDFPLGLSRLVKLYPGNIVVVAGASNVGKTSFMLELIRLNQRNHKIYYFNSEMGASELKIRLNAFDHDLVKNNPWNFVAVERSKDFADVIQPDAFNIIDFMEVYDEFYKIGGWIRDVHAKLKKGIAVIAIQKKASTKNSSYSFGRGGELTLEKPRLYLAMDRGRIEIVKAKIWRDHNVNPNGMVREFNLVQGHMFVPKHGSVWHKPEDAKYTGFIHED